MLGAMLIDVSFRLLRALVTKPTPPEIQERLFNIFSRFLGTMPTLKNTHFPENVLPWNALI
jgi:hypothetical protein